MAQAQLITSLYNLLLNRGLVSEERLLHTLKYQVELKRSRGRYMTFPQLLIAFNIIHHKDLNHMLKAYEGKIEKEPLLDVLIENDCLDPIEASEIMSAHQFYPDKYIGDLVADKGFLSLTQIEAFLEHQMELGKEERCVSFTDILSRRQKITQRMTSYLGQLGFFNESELKSIFKEGQYLPLLYKPLGDILVLMGLIRENELQQALAEMTNPEREPLLHVMMKEHLIELWQLAHVKGLLSNYQAEPKNPAIRLVEGGYIQASKLIQIVIQHFSEKHKINLAPAC